MPEERLKNILEVTGVNATKDYGGCKLDWTKTWGQLQWLPKGVNGGGGLPS